MDRIGKGWKLETSPLPNYVEDFPDGDKSQNKKIWMKGGNQFFLIDCTY